MAPENEHQNSHDHEHETPRDMWFVPSQLMLLVEFPAGVDDERVSGWLNRALPNIVNGSGISPNYKVAEVSIFNQDERAITFITLEHSHGAPPSDEIDAQIIALVNWINSHILPDGDGDTLQVWSFTENDVTASIQAAAPNWAFGGAPHQQADGGPGGQPVPPNTFPTAQDYEFHLPAEIANLPEGSCGLPVDVVILDTAPPETAITNAKAKYPKDTTKPFANPLLHAALAQLTILRPPNLPVLLPPPPTATGSGYSAMLLPAYDMSDHGLFIASIIHSIAPDASLYLYETLNSHGVGSVATLIKGLEHVSKNLLSPAANVPRTLVINISQCIGFHKLADLIEDANSLFALFKALNAGAFGLAQYVALLLKPLHDAIDAVKHSAPNAVKVVIIASAGNDGLTGARYPAAYQDVTAVGALDHSGQPAAYSNIPASGVMVFGGSTLPSPNQTMTDPDHGVLGVYIGQFPNAAANHTGFARWSGTSFAAAVMSGICASLAACDAPTAQADSAQGLVAAIETALATSADGVKQGTLS